MGGVRLPAGGGVGCPTRPPTNRALWWLGRRVSQAGRWSRAGGAAAALRRQGPRHRHRGGGGPPALGRVAAIARLPQTSGTTREGGGNTFGHPRGAERAVRVEAVAMPWGAVTRRGPCGGVEARVGSQALQSADCGAQRLKGSTPGESASLACWGGREGGPCPMHLPCAGPRSLRPWHEIRRGAGPPPPAPWTHAHTPWIGPPRAV